MKNQINIVCSHACNKKYQHKGTGSKVAIEPPEQAADGIGRYKNAESRIEPKLQRLVNAVLLRKKGAGAALQMHLVIACNYPKAGVCRYLFSLPLGCCIDQTGTNFTLRLVLKATLPQ